MCLSVYMGVYTHMCDSPKLTPGIFLDSTPCYLLRQGLSLNLELWSLVSLAGQLAPGICLPNAETTGNQHTTLTFKWVLGT